MAKHRLQRESNVSRSMRGVLVVGAVTVGGATLAVAPATAATVNIPGLGDIAVPDMPAPPQFALPALPPLPELPQLPVLQPWFRLPLHSSKFVAVHNMHCAAPFQEKFCAVQHQVA